MGEDWTVSEQNLELLQVCNSESLRPALEKARLKFLKQPTVKLNPSAFAALTYFLYIAIYYYILLWRIGLVKFVIASQNFIIVPVILL